MNALVGGQSRHAVSTQSSCVTSRLFLALLVSVLLLTLGAGGGLGAAVDGKAQADRLCEEGDELAEQGDDEGAQVRWEEALDIYRELGLAGEQASVLHRLGTRLRELQRYQEAQACFEAAIAVEPDCWQALDGWGKALLLWSKMTTGDEAEHLLRLSLEKSAAAHHIEPWQGAYNAACAAALLGEEDECRKWLDRVYEVGRPPSQDSLLNDPDLESVRHKDWFMAYGLLPVQGHSTQYFGGELRWHTGGTPAKAISPASSEVVFSREDTWPPTQSDILKSSIDGSDEVSLTEIAGIGGVNCGPAWSPDGSQIAFQHCDPVEGLLPCKAGFHTWVMSSDGSDAHRLLPEGSGTSSWPMWVPDGSRLVVARGDPWDPLAQVGIVVDLAGTEVQQVLPGERGPCCPEGSPVAFVDQQRGEVDGEAGWWNRLIIEDADGSNRRTAVEQFIADADIRARYPTQEQLESAPDLPWLLDVRNWVGPNHVIYSPDDSKIAFLAALPFDPDGPLYKEQVDVWVYDLATEDLTRVTNDDVWQHSLVWLSEELGDPREAMNYHQQLGFTLQGQGDPRAALNNFEAAATIAREQAWPEEEAGRLMEMAGAVADSGDLDRALGLYREAIAIYHRLGLEREEVRTRYTMGSRLAEFGKYQEAQAVLQEALALCRELGIEKSGDMGEVLFHLAQAARDSAKYEEAMDYLNQALVMYEELGDPRGAMNTHQQLGYTRQEQGDLQGAIEHYEAAAAIAREHNWPTEQAQHLEEMAGAAADMGDLDGALGLCREAIAIYHRLGLRREEVRPLWEIGRRLGEVGRYEEARAVLEEARALCRELGIEKSGDMGEVLFHLAQAARDSAKYEEAMDYLNQALVMYEELGDPRGAMNTHQHLGFTLQGQGDPRGALKHYEAAATIAREQDWPSEEAGRLMEMAGAVADLGDLDRALGLYREAIAIYESLGLRREEVRTRYTMGSRLAEFGKYQEAQAILQEALALCRELGIEKSGDMGEVLFHLAQVARDSAKYQEAMDYLNQALALYQELADPRNMMNTHQHLGFTLQGQGDLQGAIEHYEAAAAIAREHNWPTEQAQHLEEMAGAAADMGDLDRALGLYREAIAIYHRLGLEREEVRTRWEIGRRLGEVGRYEEARAVLKEARALCRELGIEKSGDMGEVLFHLGAVARDSAKYEEAMDYLNQALALYQELADPRNMMNTHQHLGFTLQGQGDPRGALKHYEAAATIAREQSWPNEEAGRLMEMAGAAIDMGDQAKATDLYGQMIAIYQPFAAERDWRTAQLLDGLGQVAKSLSRYEEATGYLGEALAIYEEIGRPFDTMNMRLHLGYTRRAQGDERGALEQFEIALTLSRQHNRAREEAQYLVEMAGPATRIGEYTRAVELLREALTIYHNLGPLKKEVRTTCTLAGVLRRAGNQSEGQACLEQARSLCRELPAERDLADALGVLAGKELGFSQEDQARQHREQAIAIYRKLGLKEDEARTLRSTGSHLSEAGRFLEAQEFLEQSLGIYREVSNSQAQAGVLNELGVVAFRLGRYEQSCSYMDQSIAIYEELGQRETPGCALRLLNRGCAMIYLGDYEEAIDSVEEALAIYQETGVRQPLADIHLGLAAYRLGDYDKAQEHLEKALASARELGDREAEGRALGILSMRAVGVAKYPEGLDYAEEAVSVFRRHGPRFREADQLSALGSAAAQLGEYDQASRCFEQARGIYRTLRFDHAVFSVQVEEAQLRMDQLRLPDAREILAQAGEPLRWGAEQAAIWHLAWGRYHFLTGEPDEALRRFEQAGPAAGADSSQLTASHIGLGLAHEALGNLEQAVAAYGRAVELSEHSRSRTSTAERVRFFEARAVCFRRLEAYEGLVRVLHRMHRDEDAFFWSEHTKARVLVEAMARAPHGSGLGLPAELRQQEEDLTNRIAALSSRGEEGESSQEQLRRLYAERDALVDRLRREYPEYASMQYPLPLHASELSLAPNEVLLAYEVTEPQSYLFLVRGGEVERVHEIKLSRPELTDLVERFRSSFVQVTSAADLKALDLAVGEKLYDLLLRSALAGVEADEQVVVVPDEAIGLVPLEALVVRSDGGSQWRATRWGPAPTGVDYVGDTRVFAYWQSGTTMTTVRRLRKAVPGDRVLLVADSALAAPGDCAQPVFQAGGAEQPTALSSGAAGTLRDGQPDGPVSRSTGLVQFTDSLRRAYGERVWVMPGVTATWSVLQREPLDRYSILVFAMHGVLSGGPSGQGQPALVLSGADGGPSENGHLTMTDVMGLNLRAEIVTLMACETGAGELAGGEGIMAMGRAFQYAGARSVLVSLWKVEDESTNLLAQAFFEKMAAGRPKLEALQAARRVLRESGYEHPFFWAPFVLIGEGEVSGTPGRCAGRLASTSPN